MANTKISALTALTGANLATDDAFAVVDTSATATKKITVAEMKLGIMPAPGPIGGTTPSTVATTALSTSGAITMTGAVGYSGGAVRYIGGNVNVSDWYINSPTGGALKYAINQTLIMNTSVTGLAVTGTISATSIITPGTFTTGTRPAKTLGGIIFDTTLNKLLIGGVSAWEVVTSI